MRLSPTMEWALEMIELRTRSHARGRYRGARVTDLIDAGVRSATLEALYRRDLIWWWETHAGWDIVAIR